MRDAIIQIYTKLWGKSDPYHPLICHMIDAGNVAKVLISHNSVFSNIKTLFYQNMNIPNKEIERFIPFLIACHDIGKCHPLFQVKDNSLSIVNLLKEQNRLMSGAPSKGYLHEVFSSKWIQEYLCNNFDFNEEVFIFLGDVISLHHQRKTTDGDLEYYEIDTNKQTWWNEQRKRILDDLKIIFKVGSICIKKINHKDEAGVILEGLLIMSDWVASNTDFFPCITSERFYEEGFNIEIYTKTSLSRANDAIKSLGFVSDIVSCRGTGFKDVWTSWQSNEYFSLRPLQSACEHLITSENLDPGLVILEAPMGEGKTEAAIYIAMQWMKKIDKKGIYFALPTATTSNQMYDRVNDFLKHDVETSEKVKLIHATAWMLEESENAFEKTSYSEDNGFQETVQRWFAPNRVGLLKPWAVGTVDQAMSAALQVRFGVLRWLGLSQKILIIDEIHAYDVFMETIIEKLLEWCSMLKIPVILLSATLPSNRRLALINAYSGIGTNVASDKYPLISHVSMDGQVAIYQVEGNYQENITLIKKCSLLGEWVDVAKIVVDRIEKDGGCVCIIVNTVNDAQTLYEKVYNRLAASETDITALLFHARFVLRDRKRIEEQCLKLFDRRSIKEQRKPTILIATQVVEQSLDLDFDWIISSIAPIDLLLQRIGRLHRHAGRIRPYNHRSAEFVILVPKSEYNYGANAKVYTPWFLYITEKHIPDHVRIPGDIRSLVEMVYNTTKPDNESLERDFYNKMEYEKQKKASEAKQFLLSRPQKDEFTLKNIPELDEEKEDSTIARARTRAGDDSIMLVLVEEKEFEVLIRHKYWNESQVKELLNNSVSVPIWKRPTKTPVAGYKDCIQGKGKLSHALVVPMKQIDGKWIYEWKSGLNGTWYIENNQILGVIIRRRDYGE